MVELDILRRALEREKKARKEAEKILEDKSLELYKTTLKLKESNYKLKKLLKENSNLFEEFVKNFNDAYIVIDIKGNVLNMNENAVNLFGYNIQKESLNVISLIYEKDFGYAMSSFEELLQDGYFNNFVIRILTKKKEIKWIQINANIIYDSNKKPVKAQGIIRDVTKERLSKKLLEQSESVLTKIISSLEGGILFENEERKIVLTNDVFCKLFNITLSPDDLIGVDCSRSAENSKNLFSNPDKFIERINQILFEKKKVLGDKILMNNGTVLERDFIPIFYQNKYSGHLWFYRDITLKENFNVSLRKEKEKYSSVINNMNLGLIEVDIEDRILMINKSFVKMSGYNEEELIGRKAADIFLTQEKQKFIIKKQNQKRIDGKSGSYQIKIKDKNKNIRTWLISGAPNYNIKGELIGTIGIHLDITKIKELELQKINMLNDLEQSNHKLEQYAHVVSHDLKAPLRSINALANWIKQDNLEKFDTSSLQNFDLLDNTLEKMESLISGVLNYSKISSKTKINNTVDLDLLLQEILKTLILPENIKLKVINKLPIVNGDKIKFQQLFENLIDNAIKYNDKENGIIEIDCKNQNSFYQFSIKDNGIGIPKKYFNRIFNLFQSLKIEKQSTGIGLSIVKNIVQLYGGEIWLESEPNKFSIFYFTIKK